MKLILLVSACGAGKGTLGQALMEENPADYIHLSTGDMIRDEVAAKSAIGNQFAERVKKNAFIDDGLLMDLVKERLSRSDVQRKKVLLDGFPRSKVQSEMLVAHFAAQLDRVILLQASDDLCIERILNRRTDPVTHKVYNLKTMPPPPGAVADRLVRRQMDAHVDVIKKRLRGFHATLGPIISVFAGRVFAVDSSRDVRSIVADVKAILQRPLQETVDAKVVALALEKEQQRRAAERAKPLPPPKPVVMVKDGRGECVVCRDALATTVFLPCGHQSCCGDCAQLVMEAMAAACPVCRSRCSGVVEVQQAGFVVEGDEKKLLPAQQPPQQPSQSHLSARQLQLQQQQQQQQQQQNQQQASTTVTNSNTTTTNNDADGPLSLDDILGTGWIRQESIFESGTSGAAAASASAGSPSTASSSGSPIAAAKRAVTDFDLHIIPCESSGSSRRVALLVGVPEDAPVPPLDLVCAVDVSSSQKLASSYQDPHDETKQIEADYSQLDLCKHGVAAIIEMLGDNDRLALVDFDDSARTVLPLTPMDAAGKTRAVAALMTMKARRETNIWSGLEQSLEILKNAAAAGSGSGGHRNRHIVLLGDGQSTEAPPDGEAEMLATYLEQHKTTMHGCLVSTAGFGYQINSREMLKIAQVGRSSFGFICDAKLLGQNLVCAVANARTCCVADAKLHLVAKGGCQIAGLVDDGANNNGGGGGGSSSSSSLTINVGPLHVGQQRDIVINMQNLDAVSNNSNDAFLDATLEFIDPRHPSHQQQQPRRIIAATGHLSTRPTPDALAANARASVCSAFARIIDLSRVGDDRNAHTEMRVLHGKLTGMLGVAQGHPVIHGMSADCQLRAAKSISTEERFRRWGGHYLRALLSGHRQQCRTNDGMDPGLQNYGGARFEALVAAGAHIFKKMQLRKSGDVVKSQQTLAAYDPTKPGLASYQPVAHSTTYTPPPPRPTPAARQQSDSDSDSSMWGGGCFAESCNVELENGTLGTTKKISNIRRGDRLRMADGSFSAVKILVELRKARGDLVEFEDSGLLLTPNHPVRLGAGGFWERPLAVKSVATKKRQTAPAVFNVVFEQKPVCGLLVNGVECVTYHHDIAALEHPFYSSDKIIERLRECEGFEQGSVVVRAASLKK